MGIGASLVLIAVGAILRFAVSVNNPNGFNYHTAGVILMIVGAIGLVVTLFWIAMRRNTRIIHEGPTRGTYSDPPSAY
jgi:hypothetical protein